MHIIYTKNEGGITLIRMLFYLIEKLFHCTVRNNLASLSKKIWKINTIFTLRTAIVALILHRSLYIIKFVINNKKN